jgi:hypothetical protein
MARHDYDEPPHSLLRVRVTADDDPSALTRLLGLFQNLNVTPRAIVAEVGIYAVMHISIDVCGLPEERVSLVTAKIAQSPCVRNAYWHRLV